MKTTKNKNLENILDNLSNNTMFRLFLGSKELFHSNYWAMLINKHKDKIINVFYSGYKSQDELEDIRREKDHTDLSFRVNSDLIIIENKFKSKPDLEQLKQYAFNNKYNNLKRIILISYFFPCFLTSDEFTPKYDSKVNVYEYKGKCKEKDVEFNLEFELEYISYDELYKRLESTNIKKDKYFEDYLKMLELMNELKKSVSLKLNGKTYKENFEAIEKVQNKAEEMNFYSFIQIVTLAKLCEDLIKDDINTDWENYGYSGKNHLVFLDLMKYCPKNYLCGIESMGITITLSDENIRHHMGVSTCENKRTREQIEEDLNNRSQNELSWFLKDCTGHKNNKERFKGYDSSKRNKEVWLYKYTKDNIVGWNYERIKDYIKKEINNIKEHIYKYNQ